MKKTLLLTLGVFLTAISTALITSGTNETTVPKEGWRPVYKHSNEGDVLWGDKDALLDAIRKGYDIRIGWGAKGKKDATIRIEHVVEPVFLSIIKEDVVSAVLDEHIALDSYIREDKQQFNDPKVTWSCVLTTEGTFNAVWYNRLTGEKVRDYPQKHTMTWYVEYPKKPCKSISLPLYAQDGI
ncbi:MAG: hypothetical protein AAFX87_20840 [Bacteroidota bacterium]